MRTATTPCQHSMHENWHDFVHPTSCREPRKLVNINLEIYHQDLPSQVVFGHPESPPRVCVYLDPPGQVFPVFRPVPRFTTCQGPKTAWRTEGQEVQTPQ